MTTYSDIAQLPLPENTDALVAQSTFGDYATALDSQLVPPFSTATARDAAMLSGKVEGQLCTVAGELQYWDGQTWWNQANTRYVTKAADTARSSTIVSAADPHLTFAAKSGGIYRIQAWLVPLSASTSVNFRAKWGSVGGNVTFSPGSLMGPAAGVTSVSGVQVTLGAPAATSDAICGTPTSTQNCVIMTTVATAAADDTIHLMWAQGTSSATALTLAARSFIEYSRIS